jgi:DNA primase
MNIEQAKQMALSEVLATLGHRPVRERKGELWYCSPLREENEASFKLSRDGQAWYDHGAGLGGNVLDFAMAYFQTGISGALQELSRLPVAPQAEAKPSPSHTVEPSATEPAITVTSVQPITSRALIAYLRQRGISPEVAQPYVQELHYQREGQPYFALAFTNDSGGHELRNPYFKGTQGAKDITVIRPKEDDCF